MIEIVTGDALKVLASLELGRFNFVLADPPFNLGKDYGDGINDKRSEQDYRAWLSDFYLTCYKAATDNAVLYAFCGADQVPLARRAIEGAGWQYVQMLIWYGPNGFGRKKQRYRVWATLYEPIIYARKGDGLPGAARPRWYHAVQTVYRPQSNWPGGRWHVAQKPVEIYRRLLQAHADIVRVLDPTVGSGSSLVACAELGIDALGIEINPETAQLARDRVRAAEAGMAYRHARQGQTGLFTEARCGAVCAQPR